MANISVTYTFSNGTTADATQVNQNFTDIINGLSDGTKDLSISALTVGGNFSFTGTTFAIGNATSDTITTTARLASDLVPSANATYDLGSSTLGFAEIYLGLSTFTTKLATGATASWTFTFPTTTGVAGQGLVNQGSGTVAWKYLTADTSAKSADYTVTDTDMIRTVVMTTAGTDRVVTLPTAADNTGRILTIVKTDSGTGKCTVKGEAAGETVGGVSGTTGIALHLQYESMTVHCDGSTWHVLAYKENRTWTAFTATISGFGVGDAVVESYYRRNGDSIDIRWAAVWGSTTSYGSSLEITLPNSWTIDTAKLTDTPEDWSLNYVKYYDLNANNHYRGHVRQGSSTAKLQFSYHALTGGGNNNVSSTVPFTWASGDKVVLEIAGLPISGMTA